VAEQRRGAVVSATRPRNASLIVLKILQRSAQNFAEDRGTQMAAAIAYFALFSLFPLMALAVSVFGIVLRDDELRQRVVEALVEALPVEAPGIADSLYAIAQRGPTLTAVSLVATLWSASALLSAVRRSLSVAFDGGHGRPALRAKALDLLLLPLAGIAFLASFVLTAGWRIAQRRAEGQIPLLDRVGWAWDLGALVLPAALAFMAFLFAYWLLPRQRVHPKYLWGGALVATAGFELVKLGFAIYVANFSNLDVVYGSLAGVLALLFWVYLSANMLLFGAEVAAETPRVLFDQPRHGRVVQALVERSWRRSLWDFVRGLVLAPGDEIGPPTTDERLARTLERGAPEPEAARRRAGRR
jgi:membrane protein